MRTFTNIYDTPENIKYWPDGSQYKTIRPHLEPDFVPRSLEDLPIYSGSFDEFGDEIPMYHDFKRFPEDWKAILASQGINESQTWNSDQRSGYNQTLFYLFQRSAKRQITYGIGDPRTKFQNKFEQHLVFTECRQEKEILVATIQIFVPIIED